MLDINRILKSNRQMKALTGMNIVEFELLVPRIDDFISQDKPPNGGSLMLSIVAASVDKWYHKNLTKIS